MAIVLSPIEAIKQLSAEQKREIALGFLLVAFGFICIKLKIWRAFL